jgi:hypothetical protein
MMIWYLALSTDPKAGLEKLIHFSISGPSMCQGSNKRVIVTRYGRQIGNKIRAPYEKSCEGSVNQRIAPAQYWAGQGAAGLTSRTRCQARGMAWVFRNCLAALLARTGFFRLYLQRFEREELKPST